MITIQQATEEAIAHTPFLEEALGKHLINLSALAREIQPVIEKRLYKDVQTGAIVMALQRFSQKLPESQTKLLSILRKINDITVRSNIVEFTFTNSPGLTKKQAQLFEALSQKEKSFLTISDGVFESSLFASANLAATIEELFQGETLRTKVSGLSSITLIIPEEATNVPGVYYSILKTLAWHGINFVEVVSSFTELTIFLENKNVDQAFSALKKLT